MFYSIVSLRKFNISIFNRMSIAYGHDNCLLCTKKVSYLKKLSLSRKGEREKCYKTSCLFDYFWLFSCFFFFLFYKIYNSYAVAKNNTEPSKYMAKKPLSDITIPQIKAPEAIPKSENIKKVDIACPLRSVVVL